MSQGSVDILSSGEGEAPVSLVWGTFSGSKEKLYGAVYFEVVPGRSNFKKFTLALYETSAEISDLSPGNDPLAFKEQVKSREGPGGNITQSDFKLVHNSFEEFIFDQDNLPGFISAIEDRNESALDELLDRLVSRFIRKGDMNYSISAESVPKEELSTSNNADKTEQAGEESVDEKEEEVSRHRVSVSTSPLDGIPPEELTPGDQIYVRAVGSVASEFPEELQSEEYDQATEPLLGDVEGIEASPDLPPDFDGEVDDYISVEVSLPGGLPGCGYVFKEERVKAKENEDKDSDGVTTSTIAAAFFGTGGLFVLLALIAYYIFG